MAAKLRMKKQIMDFVDLDKRRNSDWLYGSFDKGKSTHYVTVHPRAQCPLPVRELR